jgi:hypothetical protein
MSGMDEAGSREKYEFDRLGGEIIAALLKAADDQVTEAENLRESTKSLSDGINAMIKEQAKLLNDMNGRLRLFGESVLEAHKKFLNVPVGKN